MAFGLITSIMLVLSFGLVWVAMHDPLLAPAPSPARKIAPAKPQAAQPGDAPKADAAREAAPANEPLPASKAELPPAPPEGGPGSATILSVDRTFLGEPITVRGNNFGRGGEPVVFIGDGDFYVAAKIVGFYANDALTVEIPEELWKPSKEGRYFALVETRNPPARSHKFPFTMERNPCAGVAPKDADACAQAKANQGPCANASATEMPRCLASQPDPNWAATCAAKPPREQALCDAESQAFRECIHIRNVEQADACFNATVQRELARRGAP